MRTRLTIALAALSIAGAPTTATSQDLGGALNLGQLGATIGVASSMRAQVSRGRVATQPPARRTAGGRTATARPDALTFRADPARRDATVERWLTRIGRQEPASAATLRGSLAKGGLGRVSGRWLGRYGMSTDDAAAAAAAYLSIAWLVAQGDGGDPTRAQMAGLRDQVGRAIAASPGWASAGTAARQEFADTLLLQAAVSTALLQGAATPARRTAVSTAVADGARSTFGVDVRRMALTAQGLRPAG